MRKLQKLPRVLCGMDYVTPCDARAPCMMYILRISWTFSLSHCRSQSNSSLPFTFRYPSTSRSLVSLPPSPSENIIYSPALSLLCLSVSLGALTLSLSLASLCSLALSRSRSRSPLSIPLSSSSIRYTYIQASHAGTTTYVEIAILSNHSNV
jgi:hypothetical protein